MQPVSIAAFYFIIWWLVLFVVLPWGVSSSHELGEEVEPGTAKAAPVKPRMLLKFGITTVLAGLIFSVVYYVVVYDVIALDEIPFFPKFRSITD